VQKVQLQVSVDEELFWRQDVTIRFFLLHRDPSRETVLAHVKQHYHEAGLMLENAKNQFLTSSLTESLIAAALQQQNSATQPMITTPVAATATAVASPPTMVSGGGSVGGGRQQQGGVAKRENGETNNETSSHQHGGRGVWRGPAPYRCGHCKQVSNWKHVIQVLTNQIKWVFNKRTTRGFEQKYTAFDL
jgi:hypothetical protein